MRKALPGSHLVEEISNSSKNRGAEVLRIHIVSLDLQTRELGRVISFVSTFWLTSQVCVNCHKEFKTSEWLTDVLRHQNHEQMFC